MVFLSMGFNIMPVSSQYSLECLIGRGLIYELALSESGKQDVCVRGMTEQVAIISERE